MAGTIEAIALNLMVMTGLAAAAIKTGDPSFWVVFICGIIAIVAHIAIMISESYLGDHHATRRRKKEG